MKDMIEEAVKRMKYLEILDEPEASLIKKFKSEQAVFVSKPAFMNSVGVVYPLTDAEKEVVKMVENKYHILVYHVIRNVTEIGVMYSMLYVSDHKEQWKMENYDLKFQPNGISYPLAYVYNAGMVAEDEKNLLGGDGEFGGIGITRGQGGLCRKY